jgi:hypothetical protein
MKKEIRLSYTVANAFSRVAQKCQITKKQQLADIAYAFEDLDHRAKDLPDELNSEDIDNFLSITSYDLESVCGFTASCFGLDTLDKDFLIFVSSTSPGSMPELWPDIAYLLQRHDKEQAKKLDAQLCLARQVVADPSSSLSAKILDNNPTIAKGLIAHATVILVNGAREKFQNNKFSDFVKANEILTSTKDFLKKSIINPDLYSYIATLQQQFGFYSQMKIAYGKQKTPHLN